jgi:hypothetical protein
MKICKEKKIKITHNSSKKKNSQPLKSVLTDTGFNQYVYAFYLFIYIYFPDRISPYNPG